MGEHLNEELIELAVLFGTSYTENLMKAEGKILRLSQILLEEPFGVFKVIKKTLKKIVESVDSEYLSGVLKTSSSFLLMLLEKSKKHGQCLICDQSSKNLKRHLFYSHNCDKRTFLIYKNSFGPLARAFIPKEVSKKGKFYTPKKRPSSKSKAKNGKSKSFHKEEKKSKKNLYSELHKICEQHRENVKSKNFFGLADKPLTVVKEGNGKEMGKENTVICEICKVPYKASEESRHMNAHKLNQIVKCEVCDKELRKKSLVKHMSLHS